MSKKKDIFGRVWAGIVYPSSAPRDWLSRLEYQHVPMAISPLHEPDYDDRKPHHHVLVKFDGNKSLSQVRAIFEDVNGIVLPAKIESVSGYARYLCHLDDPKKQQLDVTEVITFGGFDYSQYLVKTSEAERKEMLTEIENFVMDNCVTEYAELRQYAREQAPEWIEILHNPAFVRLIDTLIKSVRHSLVVQAEN